jgi:hypothetical protein
MKTRKELYQAIKENNLQELIQSVTGKNYTNNSTAKLQEIVEDYLSSTVQVACDACDEGCCCGHPQVAEDCYCENPQVEPVHEEEQPIVKESVGLVGAFKQLIVELLVNKRITSEQADRILKLLY